MRSGTVLLKSTGALALVLLPLFLISCGLFRPEDEGETIRGDFMWDERYRTYRIHIPPSYDDSQPVPLVIAFHGAMGSGRDMQEGIAFDSEANKRGYITVYPNSRVGTWAIGCNCTEADRLEIDDLGFTEALIDTISASYTIDQNRMYAMGFSQGGMFIHRLACESTGRFAALATIAATMPISLEQSCEPPAHIPMLIMQGTEDPLVPWEGSPGLCSVDKTVSRWITLNGCPSQPVVTRDDLDDGLVLEHKSYAPCEAETAVHLYAIIGGSHTWPDGDIRGNRIIADFFDQHTKSVAEP